MSDEKPEAELEPKAGDVWVNDDEKTPDMLVISVGNESFDAVVSLPEELVAKMVGESEDIIATAELGDCQVASLAKKGFRLSFNVFDLLSGDPTPWAAALRFAPGVFLLEVGEGEGKRQVVGLPKGLELEELLLQSPTLEDGLRAGYETQSDPHDGTRSIRTGRWYAEGWREGKFRTVIEADFPTAVNAALKEGDEDAQAPDL